MIREDYEKGQVSKVRRLQKNCKINIIEKERLRMNCYQIMAVRICNRDKSAVEVQRVLTEYGCSILTRLGLHDQSTPGTCSPSGLLVLQLCCCNETSKALEGKLNALDGVKAQLVDLSD